MLGLIVVVVLMGGIICMALVQTRSAYTASIGSVLDVSNLQSPDSGATCEAPSRLHLIEYVTCLCMHPTSRWKQADWCGAAAD